MLTVQFSPITIPVIEGVSPAEPFMLRKNATAQIIDPLTSTGSVTIKVKGIEYEATIFENEFQCILWGIGPELMFQLGTLGSMFFGKAPRPPRDEGAAWAWTQHDPDIAAGIIASKDIVTKDTEVTYVITPRITTDEDWGLTVAETIPGRTPQETTTHEFQPQTYAQPFLASEAFPMTFYIGWIPVDLRGVLGLQIYSKPFTPGSDRGLIYTEISVA